MVKKCITKFNIMLAVEIITVLLVALGFLPRDTIFFLTGILVFYVLFSPLEEGIILLILSVPFFLSLPFPGKLDFINFGRVLLTVLFLKWLFIVIGLKELKTNPRLQLRKIFNGVFDSLKSNNLYLLTLFLAVVVFLSVFVAEYPLTSIKRIMACVNVFMIFPLILYLAKSEKKILDLMKPIIASSAIVIFIGYVQLASIFLWPLYKFWGFWARNVSTATYGTAMGKLLLLGNSWFSYYPGRPPTLRMFSIFPDSHSFALFAVLSIPFAFALFLYFLKSRRNLDYGSVKLIIVSSMLALVFCGIVLSGTRGAWVSMPFALLATFILWIGKPEIIFKNTSKEISKFLVATFIVSVFFFPISSQILSLSQKVHHDPEIYEYEDEQNLLFEKLGSITDASNVSNQGRIYIWMHTLTSVAARPFLGVGFGNFPVVLGENIETIKQGSSAHNLYLNIAAESGLIASSIVIVIFLLILLMSWENFVKTKNFVLKSFSAAFGIALIWVLAYSMFDVVLLNDRVLLFFLVGTATLFAINKLSEKIPKARPVINAK